MAVTGKTGRFIRERMRGAAEALLLSEIEPTPAVVMEAAGIGPEYTNRAVPVSLAEHAIRRAKGRRRR